MQLGRSALQIHRGFVLLLCVHQLTLDIIITDVNALTCGFLIATALFFSYAFFKMVLSLVCLPSYLSLYWNEWKEENAFCPLKTAFRFSCLVKRLHGV